MAYNIDGDETPVEVPKFIPSNASERRMFEEGLRLYNASKAQRQKCRVDRAEIQALERNLSDSSYGVSSQLVPSRPSFPDAIDIDLAGTAKEAH